jgi:hypothetical protein
MIREDRGKPGPCGLLRAAALALVGLPLLAAPARAYTAAGDRIFQANILLPQIAPSDELYFRSSTLPLGDDGPGSSTRITNAAGVFDKTITERLGVRVEGGYNWLQRDDASTLTGWQNVETGVQYLAIRDFPHEFLFSVGVNREFGTGATRIGASRYGATTPTVYFGKGLGDIGIDYLRPLAVKGIFGYQLSDAALRPDQWVTGLALEYSIPYLESKVKALGLPAFLQNVTPQVEFSLTTPARSTPGSSTSAIVAPGFSYAGEGWEFAVEALVPVTRSAGSGAGIIAQFHLSLDFFFPNSVGKPLLSAQ